MTETTPNKTSTSKIGVIMNWIKFCVEKNDYNKKHFLQVIKFPLEASNRTFYRIKLTLSNNEETYIKTAILMDVNLEFNSVKSIEKFINLSKLFLEYKLNVPVIYSKKVVNGCLIVSDLGEFTYYDYIQKNKTTVFDISELYKNAINSLIKLQINTKEKILPEYNLNTQYSIMNWFIEWYLKKHCNLINSIDVSNISNIFSIILNNVEKQSRVFVHNDYHSRNLIYNIINNNTDPGIVDFQDAILGPVCYDLAYLLHDSYVNLDEELINNMIKYYWENAKKYKIKINADFMCFMKDFEYASLQRCIKTIGVFSRLFYHSNNNGYMQYIPILIKRCKLICSKYHELHDLNDTFALCE